MKIDPSTLFTSVGPLVSVWVFVALGVLSLIGVRSLRRAGQDRRPVGGIASGVLVFVSVASWFVVLAWLLSRHT